MASPASFCPQQLCDFFLRSGDVNGADVLSADSPIPSYQKCDGQTEYSAIEFANPRIAHDDRIIDVELFVEFAHRFRGVVHGNSDDLQSFGSVFPLEGYKLRNFLAAGFTPGGPEVQKNYLSTIA